MRDGANSLFRIVVDDAQCPPVRGSRGVGIAWGDAVLLVWCAKNIQTQPPWCADQMVRARPEDAGTQLEAQSPMFTRVAPQLRARAASVDFSLLSCPWQPVMV